MAYPVVESVATWTSSSPNATGWGAVTMPSGVAAGDLLVAIVASDGSPTISGPPGWHRFKRDASSTQVAGAVFWRVADGVADTLSLDVSAAEQGSAIVYRISGANFVEGASSNGSSTNSTNPGATASTSGGEYLWVVARCGDASAVAESAPSGYGSLQTGDSTGLNGAAINTAHKTGATATETPGAWGAATSEQWVTFTLAVYEAPELAGTVTDADGDPLAATLLVIDRTTLGIHMHGEYLAPLTSNAAGAFALGMPGLGRTYNVVALDPSNTLADLVASRVEPA
jgi:hypothetical protein